MKPKKPKLYLESSVINMYFQDDAPYLRDLTRQFWRDVLPHFDVYISEAVLDEIRAIEEMCIYPTDAYLVVMLFISLRQVLKGWIFW